MAEFFGIKGKTFQRQYKNKLSEYNSWVQKPHAQDWILYPENLSESLSLDEVALSDGELYSVLTSKKAKGRKGSIVAIVKGTQSDFVIEDLDGSHTSALRGGEEVAYQGRKKRKTSTALYFTYNRELERYGENTIEDAKTLFHKNSEFTLLCLHYDDEEKIMFSLFFINEILNKLNLSIHEKLEWTKDFNAAFKQEFNADKKLNSQLDKKYRDFKPKLIDFLTSEEFLEERNTVIFNIETSSSAIQNIVFHYERKSLQSFFQSIFHMNINRLFISNQRLFEMVIYDYLFRYYKALYYHQIVRKE
ncbi:thiopeptide-type bacteriocin biosynthesis protein [Chryseobacterium antibioticum]|uniref:thiopeptide-type bacteriocin biosynthesis protein n=1 Tax=Chryseobacterium antibioticum TaxID=2728847 RepID=UPI00293BA043|nr:thiopeptide-type bacteriocin biosynthesis protein [Chryseobacterium antibioticum]